MILICRRGDGEGGTTEYLPAPEVSHGAAYLCPLKENTELKKKNLIFILHGKHIV